MHWWESIEEERHPSFMAQDLELLTGWTPVTTRLLQSKNHTAWNYFDDPRGNAFSDALSAEMESTTLRPAKTTTEATYEAIRGILASSPVYRAARESQQQYTASDDGSALVPPGLLPKLHESNMMMRGDQSTFLDREYRSTPEFRKRHPLLASWIQSVENTAVHHLEGDSMSFDLSQTSVQLAEYPGDGTSRYPAHFDSMNGNNKRLLTVIYYLTPHDWCATHDGGCLRVFHGDDRASSTAIVPYGGRTVVFRSDAVQHAVQPSLRRPRRAITIWLYGTDKLQRNEDTSIPRSVSDKPDRGNERSNGPPPLDCDSTGDTSSSSTIFVSIAAYRDSETGPTIRDLFATAKCPDRIRVGLVLQIDTRPSPENEDSATIVQRLPRDESWWNDQVRLLQLDARCSTGPCNARAMVETLYRKEDYILQIDAHMRFRRNWDVFLIQQLHQCPQPQRSVLTAYPVGYTLPNEIPNETRGTLLVPWKFDANGMLRIKGRLFREQQPQGQAKPVLCHLYAAGFNFSMGPPPVPYDGTLHNLFFGEESSMAVRLFTAGVDTYAPSQTVVYHLWTRRHRPPSVAPANPSEAERSRAIVTGQLLMGRKLGPGCCERTVDAFAKAIGVDFASQTVLAADIGRHQDEVELLDDGGTADESNATQMSSAKLGSVPSALINGFLG